MGVTCPRMQVTRISSFGMRMFSPRHGGVFDENDSTVSSNEDGKVDVKKGPRMVRPFNPMKSKYGSEREEKN